MKNHKVLSLPKLSPSIIGILGGTSVVTITLLWVFLQETGILWIALLAIISASIFIVKKYLSQGIFGWIIWVTITFNIFTSIPLLFILITGDFSNTYMETSGLFDSERDIIIYTALAGLLYAIALICLAIGYNSKYAQHLGSRLPYFHSEWSRKKTFLVVLSFSLVGLIGYLIYMEQLGGIKFIIKNMYMRSEAEFVANKYFKWMAMLWGSASYILLAHYYACRGGRWIWLHLGIFIFILFSLGMRGNIIWVMMTACVLYNYLKRNLKISPTLLVNMAIIGCLFATITYLRAAATDIRFQYIEILNGNYGGINQLAMVLKAIPEKLDFMMGRSISDVVFMPIPRFIWPAKPIGLGHAISQAIWPGAKWAPAPYAVTEFFINFHIVGIILGMAFFGFCGRVIYSYLVSNAKNPAVVLIYSTLLLSFGMSALSAFIISYAQTFIPLTLAIFFISGRIRKLRRI